MCDQDSDFCDHCFGMRDSGRDKHSEDTRDKQTVIRGALRWKGNKNETRERRLLTRGELKQVKKHVPLLNCCWRIFENVCMRDSCVFDKCCYVLSWYAERSTSNLNFPSLFLCCHSDLCTKNVKMELPTVPLGKSQTCFKHLEPKLHTIITITMITNMLIIISTGPSSSLVLQENKSDNLK